MKHGDEENVYYYWVNFKVFKALSPIMKSLKQNWGKKDLNLHIMYEQ